MTADPWVSVAVDYGNDLEIALRLASKAARTALHYWRNKALAVGWKEDGSVVSAADREIEAELRQQLSRLRPEDAVLGEEGGLTRATGSSRCWVLDPIDGTQNFVRGRLGWGTLIALTRDGIPVLGIISMPALSIRCWGAAGIPADSDDGLLQVSDTGLAQSDVAYMDPHLWRPRNVEYVVHELAARSSSIHAATDASAFVDVAAGRHDGAVSPGGAVWDLAAPFALIRAAGGHATDLAGSLFPDRRSAIMAGAALHGQIRDIVERRDPQRHSAR